MQGTIRRPFNAQRVIHSVTPAFQAQSPIVTPESVNGSSERRTQQEPPQKSALVKDDGIMIL